MPKFVTSKIGGRPHKGLAGGAIALMLGAVAVAGITTHGFTAFGLGAELTQVDQVAAQTVATKLLETGESLKLRGNITGTFDIETEVGNVSGSFGIGQRNETVAADDEAPLANDGLIEVTDGETVTEMETPQVDDQGYQPDDELAPVAQ